MQQTQNNPAFARTLMSRSVCSALLVMGLLAGLITQAQIAYAQESTTIARKSYSVPAGPLGSSLADFASQAGVTIQIDASVVEGRQSAALNGSFTVQEGFARLLSGSGMTAIERASRVYVLRMSTAESTLPAVTVSGSNDGTTEATGSYAQTGASKTATGLGLSLRETPQSISVITNERIQDQQMTTVADALRATAGVSVKAADRGRNAVSVRGFDVSNFQIDGMPVVTGNVGVETASTVIYDRVEVVRGSTGLMGGAGDPAATVNLVRKHANSKTFAGVVSAKIGSWGEQSVMADMTTPLNDDASVRGRFVASKGQADSFVDLEHTRNTTVYGVIDADLSADTHLSFGFSSESDRRQGVYWGGLPFWYSDGTRTDWNRSKTTATSWNRWDTDEQTIFATLEHTLANDWSVRVSGNYYRQKEVSNLLWVTGEPDRTTGLGMSAYPYYYVTKPRQAQINATLGGPFQFGGREHELMLGAIYGQVRSGWDNGNVPLNASVSTGAIGNFFAWNGSFPAPVWGVPEVGSRDTTTQAALYGATRLQLTDAMKAVLGGRLTRWKQDNEQAAWTSAAYTLRENAVFTPYAGLLYDLTPQMTAYASYTTIFKPQSALDRHGNYLDPLEGKNYELGLKMETPDKQLSASVAVFHMQQENFAVEDTGYTVPGTAITAMRATNGVKVRGYELELTGKILTDWDVSASWISYSARDADHENVATNHPRRMFKLFTKYTLPGEWRRLAIGGGVEWQGDVPKMATNPVTGVQEKVGQPAYALVGLMARYQVTDALSMQFNIYNLFDKKYYENSWSGFTYGEPRKVLLTANYRF